ncbi:hypothetical protein HK100_007169 [Physocladia obscura]|uniref:Uncharacterized protein n=1 Tax=Physocladia obscura TaxID=109957 RepID=A0AAD5SR98_9FUNG|nr:hypothetical protein HK100_007169 [Physocladia obscura]
MEKPDELVTTTARTLQFATPRKRSQSSLDISILPRTPLAAVAAQRAIHLRKTSNNNLSINAINNKNNSSNDSNTKSINSDRNNNSKKSATAAVSLKSSSTTIRFGRNLTKAAAPSTSSINDNFPILSQPPLHSSSVMNNPFLDAMDFDDCQQREQQPQQNDECVNDWQRSEHSQMQKYSNYLKQQQQLPLPQSSQFLFDTLNFSNYTTTDATDATAGFLNIDDNNKKGISGDADYNNDFFPSFSFLTRGSKTPSASMTTNTISTEVSQSFVPINSAGAIATVIIAATATNSTTTASTTVKHIAEHDAETTVIAVNRNNSSTNFVEKQPEQQQERQSLVTLRHDDLDFFSRDLSFFLPTSGANLDQSEIFGFGSFEDVFLTDADIEAAKEKLEQDTTSTDSSSIPIESNTVQPLTTAAETASPAAEPTTAIPETRASTIIPPLVIKNNAVKKRQDVLQDCLEKAMQWVCQNATERVACCGSATHDKSGADGIIAHTRQCCENDACSMPPSNDYSVTVTICLNHIILGTGTLWHTNTHIFWAGDSPLLADHVMETKARQQARNASSSSSAQEMAATTRQDINNDKILSTSELAIVTAATLTDKSVVLKWQMNRLANVRVKRVPRPQRRRVFLTPKCNEKSLASEVGCADSLGVRDEEEGEEDAILMVEVVGGGGDDDGGGEEFPAFLQFGFGLFY